MQQKDEAVGYKPFFKEAPKDVQFESSFKPELISSIADLEQRLGTVSGQVVGFDVETKTLDFSVKDPIVGFSVSITSMSGIYVPLRHLTGENLPVKEAFAILDAFLKRNNVVGYNFPFDLMMLEAEGFTDTYQYRMFEVMTLVFAADTNVKGNDLKSQALWYLGRKAPTFDDVVGKGGSFDQVSPLNAYFYACADTANTLALFQKLHPILQKECPTTLQIDNCLSKEMPFYLSGEVVLNCEEAQRQKAELKREITLLEQQIFRSVGYPFVLDSKKQVGEALLSIGLDTGIQTASGGMKLDEKSLAVIDHPIARMVVERNSKTKQLSSYIEKFTERPKGRINLQIFRVPCLTEAAMVMVKGGQPTSIRDVSPGDQILTTSGWDTVIAWKRVGEEKVWELITEEGESISGTGHHPVMTSDGPRRLDELVRGCLVLRNAFWPSACGYNFYSKVVSCKEKKDKELVFDITMRSEPWFLANGVVTHNTGRFASGNKDNAYFMRINSQNLTKPDSSFYVCERSEGEGNVLGYSFREVTKEFKKQNPALRYVEGMASKDNVRMCVGVPSSDYYFVGFDYSQEEAQLAADMSKDPVMLKAFQERKDLHKETAVAMFGAENYDSDKRKKAKIAAFGLLFGGTPETIQGSSGLPLWECKEIYNKYWDTMRGLRAWKRRMVSQAYQNNGVCYTAYGRPRRLAWYLGNPLDRWKKFGERSVCSHRVQGTAGDVMRIVMVKAAKEIFRPEKKFIQFVSTVHDELDTCIKKSVFSEMAQRLIKVMALRPPGCTMDLRVSVEVGYSYGMMWPFLLDEATGEWTPEFVHVAE